jgi:benzoyl-CoA reductase/2-hydroxyglutaryl-CoA dehydratase subunit BcrC/BadD/HgdB
MDGVFEKLAAQPDRPQAVLAFENLYKDDWRMKELADSGKPLVGHWCNFTPEELIVASGAQTIRLDYGRLPEENSGFPMDVCCAVRALSDFSSSSRGLPKMDLIIMPTSCDGKRRLAARHRKDDDVFVLELPPSKRGEASARFWQTQVGALEERLRNLTGSSIKRRDLLAAIDLLNGRTEVVRELIKLRRQDCLPISTPDLFLVLNSAFLADPTWWVEHARILLDELHERSERMTQKPRARLLLTGSPVFWPDFNLLFAISRVGAEVVADEICSATQSLYNPVVVDESTLSGLKRAVTDKTLLPCTCPCFMEKDDRLERLAHLIESQRVDGVVQHTLRLCHGYDIDGVDLARWLASKEVPFLNLHTEYGLEESAGLQNRVEAFVEMLG